MNSFTHLSEVAVKFVSLQYFTSSVNIKRYISPSSDFSIYLRFFTTGSESDIIRIVELGYSLDEAVGPISRKLYIVVIHTRADVVRNRYFLLFFVQENGRPV